VLLFCTRECTYTAELLTSVIIVGYVADTWKLFPAALLNSLQRLHVLLHRLGKIYHKMSIHRGVLGIWAAVTVAAVTLTWIACSEESDGGIVDILSRKGMCCCLRNSLD
jgi:hypothetical protein